MNYTAGYFWMELVKGIPTALVALVIGLLAFSVAWRQKEIAKAKLKLDLFDKRYAIFHKTWVILSETVQGGARDKNYGLFARFLVMDPPGFG